MDVVLLGAVGDGDDVVAGEGLGGGAGDDQVGAAGDGGNYAVDGESDLADRLVGDGGALVDAGLDDREVGVAEAEEVDEGFGAA